MGHVRLRRKDQLGIFTDLATMLKAGIAILEAVDSLEADAKGSPRKVLRVLHKSLVNGEPLSRGMQKLPDAFDPITVNLIQAAEAGGTLEETLHDIVVTTRKELAFSESLKTTMVYPAFVMVVFSAIVILMLTFVIPRVSKVFSSMRVHMPPVTKAMIAASNAFLAHWLLISAGLIVAVILFAVVAVAQKKLIIRAILGLPGLKTLGRNIDLTRFTRSFGLLLHAGVPLDEALVLSERVIQRKQLIEVIEHMRRNLDEGLQLGVGLRDMHAAVPPMMARSIETAEATGTLEETMQNLAEYFDERVTESLKVISSLVEPVLLVIVGVMVGALMITIIAPIYNLISQISGKHY